MIVTKWGYLTLKAFKWQKINGYFTVFYDPILKIQELFHPICSWWGATLQYWLLIGQFSKVQLHLISGSFLQVTFGGWICFISDLPSVKLSWSFLVFNIYLGGNNLNDVGVVLGMICVKFAKLVKLYQNFRVNLGMFSDPVTVGNKGFQGFPTNDCYSSGGDLLRGRWGEFLNNSTQFMEVQVGLIFPGGAEKRIRA